MNSVIFRQYERPWSTKPYPTKNSTMAGCGCGVCACTHIAIEQESKKDWTPENLRTWMIKQGFSVVGQGTTWLGIKKTLEHIGHKHVVWITESMPMKDAFAELNKGNRIGVFLFYGGYSKRKKKWYKTPDGTVWTTSGHYVAFVNYKYENGKHWFYCKDSGARNHDGWRSYEDSMKGCVGQMWIVEKVGEQVTPKKATTPDGKLVIDGIGGIGTVKALQRFVGTTQDGVISSQNKGLKKYYTALKSVSFDDKPKGSATVKMLQKWLEIPTDGIWGKQTSIALQNALGVNDDGIFGKESMKALQKFLNEHTTSDKTPLPKTNGQRIAETAIKLAYSGAPDEAKYPTGKAKKEYAEALNKVYPSRKTWGAAPRAGASCDVYVGTCVRASGVDSKFPRGLDEQRPYLEKSGHFTCVLNVTNRDVKKSELKDGDIITYSYKKSGGHIMIYADGKARHASLKKWYGRTTSIDSRLKISDKKWIKVYRAK